MTEIELSSMFDLSGRAAIVTGASSGFGDRFVRVLAAAGCQVVAAARRFDRLEQLAADVPGVVPVAADVADDDDCRALVDRCIAEFGTVDVLVNNAGISDAPDRAESQDPARFRSVIEVNLNAPFVLASMCAVPMLEQGSGSIINIASVHGFVGSAPNTQAGYVASKAGLVNLTKELALQWATRGIRVNGIGPGYFETELTDEMFEADSSGLKWISRNTPMRRGGQLPELDGALLLLASNAGSYITGQTILVDGGWTSR